VAADTFLSQDPIEGFLGQRVECMTEWELISYVKYALKALYDMDLVAEGYPERAIFVRLVKTYGQENAGRIVKWSIWKYFGKYDGTYIQYSSFSKGRKWWTDLMSSEMQAQVAKELNPVAPTMVDASKLL